jgi:hypothetical protein
MKIYSKGDDYKEDFADYKTFGISENKRVDNRLLHTNKIEIYGDEELRDKIIKLLNIFEKLESIEKLLGFLKEEK